MGVGFYRQGLVIKKIENTRYCGLDVDFVESSYVKNLYWNQRLDAGIGGMAPKLVIDLFTALGVSMIRFYDGGKLSRAMADFQGFECLDKLNSISSFLQNDESR